MNRTITESEVSVMWAEINEIHPSAFDAWFGMGACEWIAFGVKPDDTPEQAYQKVNSGIEKKIVAKDPAWYVEYED